MCSDKIIKPTVDIPDGAGQKKVIIIIARFYSLTNVAMPLTFIPRIDPVEALPVAVVHDKVCHEQVGQVILVGTALKSCLEKKTIWFKATLMVIRPV